MLSYHKGMKGVHVYEVTFYETSSGYSDILDFLDSLSSQISTSKDARIQYYQATHYIELLQQNGTNLPIGFVKHLDEEIWELRPGNNRIFFFYYDNGTYILLHHFRKKSQKTPRREILRAKAERLDYISRKEK